MTEFQVICVARLTVSILPSWAVGMHIPCPEVGSEYTVCNVLVKDDGLTYYELVGFVDLEMDARAFATLPGLSADEINELEKESILL